MLINGQNNDISFEQSKISLFDKDIQYTYLEEMLDKYGRLPIDYGNGYDYMEFISDMVAFLKDYDDIFSQFKNFSILPSSGGYIPLKDEENNSLRYRIIQRTPASNNNKGGHRDRRWILRDVLKDTEKPGETLCIYIKRYDVIIDFISWSKQYSEAVNFASAFEDIMDIYGGKYFKEKGLPMLRYEGRDDEIFREYDSYHWYGIPMRYRLITYKTAKVYEKDIQKIKLELNINK